MAAEIFIFLQILLAKQIYILWCSRTGLKRILWTYKIHQGMFGNKWEIHKCYWFFTSLSIHIDAYSWENEYFQILRGEDGTLKNWGFSSAQIFKDFQLQNIVFPQLNAKIIEESLRIWFPNVTFNFKIKQWRCKWYDIAMLGAVWILIVSFMLLVRVVKLHSGVAYLTFKLLKKKNAPPTNCHFIRISYAQF